MTRSVPRFTGQFATARSLALQVLLDSRGGDGFVQELLDQRFHECSLSSADRRLATHLAYGVLRRRGSLDALLQPTIDRPPHRVEPILRDILRLGTFQLALMTHIPAHAALYETVELTAAFGLPRAKGFVNGVLRSVAGLLTTDRTETPAADALPLETGQYRRLAQPVLPEPARYPVEYLGAAFAWPHWLAERWRARFTWDECLRLGFWFAGPAPLWLRCNPLRTNRAALLTAFAEAGITAEPGDDPQSVRLAHPTHVRELPGYEQGWFAVQDATAMRVASALAPQPGNSVLDLCAAPGGKTTHLAELMNNRGRIIACDVDERRLQTVADLSRRLGLTIIDSCRLPAQRNDELPAGPFDAVLVDVPCSNTGVLGRRPEVRWRLRPENFRNLVPLQTRLLLQASERIRPGGAIVYSTCSIEPEENRQVVQAVLQALPDFILEADEEQTPGRPADGGYWAKLIRAN